SGQEVTVRLGTVGSLAMGAMQRQNLEVGVLDMSGFPPELGSIGGFIALGFFGERPFTVDYPSGPWYWKARKRSLRESRTGRRSRCVSNETSSPSPRSCRSRSQAGGRSPSKWTSEAMH